MDRSFAGRTLRSSRQATGGTGNAMFSLSGAPVPEPSSALLLLGGAGAFLVLRRRKGVQIR